jgi:hypothetical protein
MIRLLSFASAPSTEFERLRIFDMYLLFPPLLHRTSMPQAMKAHFRQLDVPTPDSIFTRLPSVASAFQELRLYQNAAANYLAAKDILQKDGLRKGVAIFNPANLPEDIQTSVRDRNGDVIPLLHFLIEQIGRIPLAGSESIYRRAGLPARHLVS